MRSLATKVLLERVHDGDDDALGELCRRYQTRILTYVRIKLGAGLRKKIESWDIVQEVLIDALRGVRKADFKTESAFVKYLNRVVENKIRDEADRQHAQMRNPEKEVSLDQPRSDTSQNPLSSRLSDSGVPTPSQILSLNEDLLMLERAIDLLPERYGQRGEEYRNLIIAVELEEQSYQELAEEYGKSVDAIRMNVARAKAALTEAFQELAASG